MFRMLICSELLRFFRKNFLISLGVSLGIGLLIQLAGADGFQGEKKVFFNLIFSFWMGITVVVHWFNEDREYIRRLYCCIRSPWKILVCRVPVLCCIALIHATVLYGVNLINVINTGAEPSRINVGLNNMIYSPKGLHKWKDPNSEFMDNCDQGDPLVQRKIKLGENYSEACEKAVWFSFDPHNHPARWYAFFLSSFSGCWIGVMLSCAFSSEVALKLIPFITAMQIMFSKITADKSFASEFVFKKDYFENLFGPLSELGNTYTLWEPVHVISLLTPMRYLVLVAQARAYNTIFYSADCFVVYLMIVFCFAAAGFSMNRKYRRQLF